MEVLRVLEGVYGERSFGIPRRFDKRVFNAMSALAEVAKLGQRRWDEVPVLSGSQVQILPSAPIFDFFSVSGNRQYFPDSEGI